MKLATTEQLRDGCYEEYKDKAGEWRWRYTKNYNIIGNSSESYKNYADVERSVEIMKGSSDSPVIKIS